MEKIDASVNVYRGLWCAIKCAGRCSSSLPSTSAEEAATAGGGSRGRAAIKRRKSATTHTGSTQISHEGFPVVPGNNSSLLGTLFFFLSLFLHSMHIISQQGHYMRVNRIWNCCCRLCTTTVTMGCVYASLLSSRMAGFSKRHIIYAASASIVPKSFFFSPHVCDNLLMQQRGNLCELWGEAQLLLQYYLCICCFCARGLSFLFKKWAVKFTGILLYKLHQHVSVRGELVVQGFSAATEIKNKKW